MAFRHKKRPPKGTKKYTLGGLYSGISTENAFILRIWRRKWDLNPKGRLKIVGKLRDFQCLPQICPNKKTNIFTVIFRLYYGFFRDNQTIPKTHTIRRQYLVFVRCILFLSFVRATYHRIAITTLSLIEEVR